MLLKLFIGWMVLLKVLLLKQTFVVIPFWTLRFLFTNARGGRKTLRCSWDRTRVGRTRSRHAIHHATSDYFYVNLYCWLLTRWNFHRGWWISCWGGRLPPCHRPRQCWSQCPRQVEADGPHREGASWRQLQSVTERFDLPFLQLQVDVPDP